MTTTTNRWRGFVAPLRRPPPKPAPAVIPKLEGRVCACGCERRFSVLPGSPSIYASARCSQQNGAEVVL